MDYATLGISLGIFSLGAGAVYWPYSLKVERLKSELKLAIRATRDAQEAARNQISAAKRYINVERKISNARDLSPADEISWLLNNLDLDEAPAPREATRVNPKL